MFSEMDHTYCVQCGRVHLDFWTDIFLKVIRCERFQKTAEYVSELLEQYGATLSTLTSSGGSGGFAIGATGKPHVLKVVRWWSYHYHFAQERGISICLYKLTNNMLICDPTTEPCDPTRVFLDLGAFSLLIDHYQYYVRHASLQPHWLLLPAENVIERNLPHLFDTPRYRCTPPPFIHTLPVELKYDTVKIRKPGWIESALDILRGSKGSVYTPMHVNVKIENPIYAREVTVIEIVNLETILPLSSFALLEMDFEVTMPNATGYLTNY